MTATIHALDAKKGSNDYKVADISLADWGLHCAKNIAANNPCLARVFLAVFT